MSKMILFRILMVVLLALLMGLMSMQISLSDSCEAQYSCGYGVTIWCKANNVPGASCYINEDMGSVTCGSEVSGYYTWVCPFAV